MKKSKIFKRAVALRKKGFSYREISHKLSISKSTASLWLKDIKLSPEAHKRINSLGIKGRKKGIETSKRKRQKEDKLIEKKVRDYFSDKDLTRIDPKIACALLYWSEGTKEERNKRVSFINADHNMIKYFLYVFRKSFDIDERKFKALIHLHEYHNEKKQIEFWSSVTNIPRSQFNNSYIKSNTGKNKKKNYPGCVSVRYSDAKIYKELMLIIKMLTKI